MLYGRQDYDDHYARVQRHLHGRSMALLGIGNSIWKQGVLHLGRPSYLLRFLLNLIIRKRSLPHELPIAIENVRNLGIKTLIVSLTPSASYPSS